MSSLPPCPYLPPSRPGLDWRALNGFRDDDRGGEFYFACLEYGQTLWERQLAARALLCLDRAFAADLSGEEPEVRAWPLPYAGMAWMMATVPAGLFIGNPRVHFQHYADRMNAPRKDQRKWRAWACWALARVVQPHWPADPRHAVEEPTLEHIDEQLRVHGIPGENELWRQILARCAEPSFVAPIA